MGGVLYCGISTENLLLVGNIHNNVGDHILLLYHGTSMENFLSLGNIRYDVWGFTKYCACAISMQISTKLQSPPLSVLIFCLCDNIYHKQKVFFFLVFTRSDCQT